MIAIKFGDRLIECVDTLRDDLVDASQSKQLQFLRDLLAHAYDASVTEMHTELIAGNVSKAQAAAGYVSALTDLNDLITSGLKEALEKDVTEDREK